MISLIIPSYKNSECLDLCLQTAVSNKNEKETEIIVAIDGFPELTKEIREKYKGQVLFIVYEDNYGMQNAINSAVYQAVNPYVLIINEDNVLPYNWDTRLKTVIDKYDGMVITLNQIEPNPSIYNFDCKDFGTEPSNFKLGEFLRYEFENNTSFERDSKTGGIFPFLCTKSDFMLVGGFDVSYPGPHVVDWDFFLKLELSGLKFIQTKSISLYHFSQMSTKKLKDNDINFNELEKESMRFFTFKWGFDPLSYRGQNNSRLPKNQHIRGIGVFPNEE